MARKELVDIIGNVHRSSEGIDYLEKSGIITEMI